LIHLLRELPQAMLVASHDLRKVQELLPRTVVMDNGAIVADGVTAEILNDAAPLEAHRLEVC
jgi:cobalt/nickel transport system ATP-binding protein